MDDDDWRSFKVVVRARVFSAFDEDDHGFLYANEMEKVAKAAEVPELSKLINSADTHHDGKVNAGELKVRSLKLCPMDLGEEDKNNGVRYLK